MKNILKLGLVAVSLLVASSAFAGNCFSCPKRGCQTSSCETSCTPCKLPAPACAELELTTNCQGTPEYHWECRKVMHPCNDKVTQRKVVVREKCLGVKVEGEDMSYSNGNGGVVKKHKRNGYMD